MLPERLEGMAAKLDLESAGGKFFARYEVKRAVLACALTWVLGVKQQIGKGRAEVGAVGPNHHLRSAAPQDEVIPPIEPGAALQVQHRIGFAADARRQQHQRGGAETVRKPHAFGRQTVEIWRLDRLDAVAAQELARVGAMHQQNVGTRGFRPEPASGEQHGKDRS